jgi:methionyl-tRNA formyltransferase
MAGVDNVRVLFMGTPEFSCESLKKLIENQYNVTAVITRADTKKDRGHKLKFSPVKELAIENNITVYQPDNLKKENFGALLDAENPDIIIVTAYGKILPEYVLKYPKYGCINVHASLLPKYRGAAPMQYAVARGEKISGVTTMLMDKGLDTGDILLKREVEVTSDDTGGSLHDKLMAVSGGLLIETLKNIENIKPEKQDGNGATYAPPIKKDDTIINFNEDIHVILNKIRGFYPFPTTSFNWDGEYYKIHKAGIEPNCEKCEGKPGEIIEFSKNKLLIAAKNGIINILELQPPNKKRMTVTDFYNGSKKLIHNS